MTDDDLDDQYPIGSRLPGTKYVVVGKLGRGGMGVVYEVVKEPGIRGAAKVMSARLAKRADAVKRFNDEAARVAKLRHPNIVQVIDYDTLADGTPFFVMELLEGKTLGQLLRDTRGRGLRPEQAFAIQTQLLAGLHHAHARRGPDGERAPIIHRDIKPDNIFLYLPSTDHAEASVKVLDLGIAAAENGEAEEQFLGSYPWAAPEQFELEPATPQTDLYAAGLVLYTMLTGRNPFDGLEGHEAFWLARLHGEVPPLPEWVPAEVRDLVRSALARDPELRPRSASEFSAKLWPLQFVRPCELSPEPSLRATIGPLGRAGTIPDAELSRHDTPPAIRLALARRQAAGADTHTHAGVARRPGGRPVALARRARRRWLAPLLAAVAALGIVVLTMVVLRVCRAPARSSSSVNGSRLAN